MEVRVPFLVKDLTTTEYKDVPPTEDVTICREDLFLDGPISRRVAVLDFDESTGALLPGARFIPPAGEGGQGTYDVGPPRTISRTFNLVSAFAIVHKALDLFEDPDTLGRRVAWAFDAPQLLVVPRAGAWANAFYERESHSLQFFSFPSVRDASRTIHSSLSQDIVSHETAHAILDGICPDLYHALTPQSLALHEAMADLVALLSSFNTPSLVSAVLEQTGGDISRSTAFSALAGEFAGAQSPLKDYLRSLLNERSLDPAAGANFVASDEPHALSEVLSGALYRFMVNLYAEARAANSGMSAGKALFVAWRRFKRMVFRALDYLPAGEVSFADLGRAILASDEASHPGPDGDAKRCALRDEFVRRGIATARQLECRSEYEGDVLKTVDLATLVESDWAAYEFANSQRALLGIPEDIPFRVRPRLDVKKTYYHRNGEQKEVRECIFKVSWDQVEANPRGAGLPTRRSVSVGTTLAVEWETRKIRAVLSSDAADARKQERSRMLQGLVERDLLRFGARARVAGGVAPRCAVHGEVAGGLLRVRGSARLLHMMGGDHE